MIPLHPATITVTMTVSPLRNEIDGEVSDFTMYLTCANGFQVYGRMLYNEYEKSSGGRIGELFWKYEDRGGRTAGSCSLTTYDSTQLHLNSSYSTMRVGHSPDSVAYYSVRFE
ncbi:hypothetical protein SCB71_00400 [Herbiconiux sp. KACC 21604]|uniref:hypothetical protein n=1 Tax=unclassified Herbiconiux TaxID=2618217 RepID=UPI00149186AB|nr:hypothetical protein [Herbiconiux sp. SALV-R1]QJU55544.1 hypothetical protein HL652_19255 [Herbiconiux sp. SALV-R1]WPO86732.1 hypothetical protein SCB71_00400 [Herbiconiux sp. KACC 21604]